MSNRKCIGLNYGWVLTVSQTREMNLVHPLSRSQIQLPDQESQDFFRHEIAALSANPLESSSDFAVMITHRRGSELTYWKSGDLQWTEIENRGYYYRDLIYFQDRLYVLDYRHRVYIFSVSNLQDPTIVDLGLPSTLCTGYIVESNGDLLFVSRWINFQNYQSSEEEEEEEEALYSEEEEEAGLYSEEVAFSEREEDEEALYSEEEEEDEEEEEVEEDKLGKDYHYTLGFLVYKLDLINGGYEEIESLGDFAIFVGHNTSISLNSLNFPRMFKSDHIYFTDDYRFENEIDIEFENEIECSGKDMGSFNMEDGEITRFKVETELLKRHPPFWLIHSL